MNHGDPAFAMVDIFRLNRVTEDYLCPPEANVYGIDFTRSKMIFINLIIPLSLSIHDQ